jgi:uncharacterized protein YpmB
MLGWISSHDDTGVAIIFAIIVVFGIHLMVSLSKAPIPANTVERAIQVCLNEGGLKSLNQQYTICNSGTRISTDTLKSAEAN